ncbi:MAG: zinc ribbon domain-containing protein [Ruminiclostridium sp.]|nr:zinc ribbon domain-containing protein [Ruminiclostridium sp.]
MAFLENLGKKVGEAAQAAAKKSGELVEITKLNVNIGSEEDKIQKLYNQIGKSIFEKYTTTGVADQGVKENCEAIKVHEQNVKALKEKIMEVKNIKSCINCGGEMDRAQIFCSKCGTRNDLSAASQPEQQQAATSACKACGAVLAEGAVFCTSCGAKVG